MPIDKIISAQIRSKQYNGDDYLSNPLDFAVNLVGNVMRPCQAIINISVSWYANSDNANTWNVKATSIQQAFGSFLEDGFSVGQKFAYISDWSVDETDPIEFTAIIDTISSDGRLITFSGIVGAVPVNTVEPDAGIWAVGNATENELTGVLYRFGLIENNEPFNVVSKIAGVDNRYQASSVGVAGSTVPVSMSPQGTVKSWITGSATVEFVSSSQFSREYKIVHEFILSPWYLDGQESDIENLIPPDYFVGNNCLKLVFDFELRKDIANPSGAIIARQDSQSGFTGWFDENFNGLVNNYKVNSVDYTDTASMEAKTALQPTFRTTVQIEVENTAGSFNAGNRVGFFVSYLPAQSEYEGSTLEAQEVFLYDGAYHTEGSGATPLTGIIKEIDSFIAGNLLTITAEIEYDAVQADRIAGGSYLIGLDVGNVSLTNQTSDSVSLLASIGAYSSPVSIDDLIDFTQFNVIAHDLTLEAQPDLWNEDGIYIDFDFQLDLSKEAFLRDITFSLVAYNTVSGERFSLDSFVVDTSGAIVSGGVQQIEIDTTRAYLLPSGDVFNAVKISTGSLVGSFQEYSGTFAQKIRWQDWLRNISADPLFFDVTKPENNLNFKSSNYSGLLDYEIRVEAVSRLFGVDALGLDGFSEDNQYSVNIDVRNYGETLEGWSAVISLRDPDTDADTGGVILSDKDTIFRVTWENTLQGNSLSGLYAIHRIQESFSAGDDISELSSIRPILPRDILKPMEGESLLKVTQLAPDSVVTECLIDGDRVDINKTYNLSYSIKRVS